MRWAAGWIEPYGDLPEELPVGCLARVVRVKPGEKGAYDIAVCFLDLSGADRSKLNRFVIEKLERDEKEG